MKRKCLALAVALLTTSPALFGVDQELPGTEPLREVAQRPNPTIGLAPPDLPALLKKIDTTLSPGSKLHSSLHELLKRAGKYTKPAAPEQGDADAELRLCEIGRDVFLYHQFYQRPWAERGLRQDVREIVMEVLLYALKKMEWIHGRAKEDDYFMAYYSTLRRYNEVCVGLMFLNGKWVELAKGGQTKN